MQVHSVSHDDQTEAYLHCLCDSSWARRKACIFLSSRWVHRTIAFQNSEDLVTYYQAALATSLRLEKSISAIHTSHNLYLCDTM